MFSKIALMCLLFLLFLIVDLRYFFPVAVIILLVLNSIEKDLKKQEGERTVVREK
jgi:hypothetical protein